MGQLKKNIRADVRRAARLVINKYYQETKGKSLGEKQLKAMVRQTEEQAVPAIMTALKDDAKGG